MKQKVEKYIDGFILSTERKNSAIDLLTRLTVAIENNLRHYEDFSLYLLEDGESKIILEICGVRNETVEEYENRIAKEREEKKRIKKEIEEEVIRKRAQRFKLYQELKKEFEDETS